MADSDPPRKKLGIAAAVAARVPKSNFVKRGVRKRGGPPVEYVRPDPSLGPPQAADPRATTGKSASDSHPPRRNNYNVTGANARPPRADTTRGGSSDTRPPRREWPERPPRDSRIESDSRPRRPDQPREGNPDARPPRREWTERPPKRSGNSDPRAPNSESHPPRREWTPPRPNFGNDDTRPPKQEWKGAHTHQEYTAKPLGKFGEFERKRFEASTEQGRAPRGRGDPAAHIRGDHRNRPSDPIRVTAPQRREINTLGVQTFFATCPRGLEQLLREELLALGAAGIEVTPGGVLFKGSFMQGLRANLESRIASRVMWKLVEGNYLNEDDLFALARCIDWPAAFPVAQTIKVQVTAILSPLKSIDFIALKVKDAICDAFRDAVGSRPSVDTSQPNQRIHVFLNRNNAIIYLDVSGEALFKRGYRRDGLVAPIRENLAAGILKLVEWTPEIALLDPMCGSGTFITEALLIAMNAAPGLRRRNAHERWTINPTDEFHALKDAARARITLPENLRLFARDASPEAVQQTRAHVAALGGTAAVNFEVCDALDLVAPCEEGLMLANPPYGVRLGRSDELAQMYPQFGTCLKTKFSGWEASFITADLEMPGGLGLKTTRRIPLRNGPLNCRLFSFPIVAGRIDGRER